MAAALGREIVLLVIRQTFFNIGLSGTSSSFVSLLHGVSVVSDAKDTFFSGSFKYDSVSGDSSRIS